MQKKGNANTPALAGTKNYSKVLGIKTVKYLCKIDI